MASKKGEDEEVDKFTQLADQFQIRDKSSVPLSHSTIKAQSEHLIIAVTWGGAFPLKEIETMLKGGADPDYQNKNGASSRKIVLGKIKYTKEASVKKYYESVNALFEQYKPTIDPATSKPSTSPKKRR